MKTLHPAPKYFARVGSPAQAPPLFQLPRTLISDRIGHKDSINSHSGRLAMKRFMFLSIGVLCLAVATLIGFYIGSRSAVAQAPAEAQYFYAKDGNYNLYRAILPNGDIYKNVDEGGPLLYATPTYAGNFWGNSVGTDKSSWGGVKGQYNK